MEMSLEQKYEEAYAECKKASEYFKNCQNKCMQFASQHIKVFWHFNNNEKRINYKDEIEFVNYDGECGRGLMCQHCGKIMVQKTGSSRVLGRQVKFMMAHLEKNHSIKMDSYADSLSMFRTIDDKLFKPTIMTMRDGIE